MLVTGLEGRPEFSGHTGTVISWDEAKGRAGVQLDSGSVLSLKPSNLQPSDVRRPLTEAEWRTQLTDFEFRVLRQTGTEPPRSGEYDKVSASRQCEDSPGKQALACVL